MNQKQRKKLNTDDAQPTTKLTPSQMRDLANLDRPKIQKMRPRHAAAQRLVADGASRQDRQRIAELFRQLQDSDAFREIVDPVAWQREQRKERRLPGRSAEDA